MKKDKIKEAFERLVLKVDLNATWYPESIEEDKPVIIADWNKIDKIYPNLQVWFEDADYDTGFEDEWDYCQDCGRAIYTTPRMYGDTPNWITDEYGRQCRDCWLKNPETDMFINPGTDTPKAIQNWQMDTFKSMGFQCLGEEDESCSIFESGFYPGQNDTPKEAVERLEKLYPGFSHDRPGEELEYIFVVDCVGQFDIQWSIWYRTDHDKDYSD